MRLMVVIFFAAQAHAAPRHHRKHHASPVTAPAQDPPLQVAHDPPPPAQDSPPPSAPAAPIAPAVVIAPAVIVTRAPIEDADDVVEIALDGGIGTRRLQLNDLRSNNLQSYGGAVVALLGFHGAVHPFSRTRLPFFNGLGILLDFAASAGAQSRQANGAVVDSPWLAFDVGLHERVRLGKGRRHALGGIALEYGELSQEFSSAGLLVSGSPSVHYRYLRCGLDLVALLGPVRLFADGAYRAVLDAGYLGDRFPREFAGGIDVRIGLRANLPRGFALAIEAQYLRWFHSFHARPGDPYVAGGAVDESLIGLASAGWSM